MPVRGSATGRRGRSVLNIRQPVDGSPFYASDCHGLPSVRRRRCEVSGQEEDVLPARLSPSWCMIGAVSMESGVAFYADTLDEVAGRLDDFVTSIPQPGVPDAVAVVQRQAVAELRAIAAKLRVDHEALDVRVSLDVLDAIREYEEACDQPGGIETPLRLRLDITALLGMSRLLAAIAATPKR